MKPSQKASQVSLKKKKEKKGKEKKFMELVG